MDKELYNKGLEIRRSTLRRQHGDRHGAQMRVQRLHHLARVLFGREFKGGRHAHRMHAGIGAPGAEHGDPLAAITLHRLFQRLLDRGNAILTLPAGKRTAIPFEKEFVSCHGAAF